MRTHSTMFSPYGSRLIIIITFIGKSNPKDLGPKAVSGDH